MAVRSSSENRKVWKFAHKEDEYLITNIPNVAFKSTDGFLEISEDGKIQILGSCGKGYAWDGCTPKWEILDFTIGTPDGRFDYVTQKPMTYYASMVHDILYQHKDDISISRRVADKLFFLLLKESGFMWSWLYYGVVRFAGLFYGKWKTKGSARDLRIIQNSWNIKAYKESLKMDLPVSLENSFVSTASTYVDIKTKIDF